MAKSSKNSFPKPTGDEIYFSFNPQITEPGAIEHASNIPDLQRQTNPAIQEKHEEWRQPLPLKHIWTVWEQATPTVSHHSYADNTKEVGSISTVQDFWSLWNHMPQPSELLDGKKLVREKANLGKRGSGDGDFGAQPLLHSVDALMLFRRGVRPEWEDDGNKNGGHWQYHFRKDFPAGALDEVWNNIVLGLVGGVLEEEAFGGEDNGGANKIYPVEIMGIRLVDKLAAKPIVAGIRLEVWFSDNSNQEMVKKMHRAVENCLSEGLHGEVRGLPRCDVKPHGSH